MGVFVSYNIPFRRNLLMQITNSIITFGGSLRQKNKKDFLRNNDKSNPAFF
jgi:hypothetical protein